MAVAAGAVACGNITLTDSASGFAVPTANGGAGADASVVDGAAYGGSSGGPFDGGTLADAAGPGSVVGSPLCNYDYATDASRVCQPDLGCPAADVGADAGPYADAGADAGNWACHVVESPAGATTQTCTPPGPGGDGDQCRSGMDCGPAYECVGSPGRCRRYCCEGVTACASDNFCDVQPVASGALDASADAGAATYRVPACIPVSRCQLLQPGCPSGQTCGVVKADGTTSCVAIGPVAVGGSCETDHCAAGLTCLGTEGSRTCYQLCHVSGSECPGTQSCTSSAQLFTDPTIGICQ
jgi:hypothetical protein